MQLISKNIEKEVIENKEEIDALERSLNSFSESAGKVTQKSYRTSTGTWNITRLAVGKPVIITIDRPGNSPTARLRVISGTNDGRSSSSRYIYLNPSSNGEYATPASTTFIPTSSTLSLNVLGIGGTLRAYQ